MRHEAATHRIPDYAAAWPLVLASGFRGLVESLDEEGRARLRDAVRAEWGRLGQTSVRTDVVFGVARKA